MKNKQQCKEEIAGKNNFDSFDRAILYTFNRPLLESESNFIHKIIDEAMDMYAQEQVKNCSIPDVSHRRELLAAFVKDWYKDNPLVSEEKQLRMVDKFLAAYSG